MPAVNENMDQFFAFSFRDTLSARMTRTMTLIPAHPNPWKPLPSRRTGQACVGAAVHSALPTIIMSTHVCKALCLPKTSAI